MIDRSRQADSMHRIPASSFGVVDDDGGHAAADDGPQALLELLVVGIVGGRFGRIARRGGLR